MIITIDNTECLLVVKRYINNRTSIEAIDNSDGCPYTRLTVNLPKEELEKYQVILDINNNPSIVKELQSQNIIGNVIKTVKSGFVDYPVVEIINEEIRYLIED